jgi:c-di-GMP-binding flagellar brake protein YcgR
MVKSDIFVPGSRVKIVALAAAKSRYVTSLIGYKPGQYLAVELPLTAGITARMADGTVWSVTFVSRGYLYSFSASVMGTSRSPFPVLYFSYPIAVEETPLRREKRFPVRMEAYLNLGSGEAEPEIWPAVLQDISEGGCLIESARPLAVGAELTLDLVFPVVGPAVGLAAEVRNSGVEGDVFMAGLSFTEYGEEGRTKLRNYLNCLVEAHIRV